jgi:hypothetical protein
MSGTQECPRRATRIMARRLPLAALLSHHDASA